MPHPRSGSLPSERQLRLARRFKLAILTITASIVVGLLSGTTVGRHAAHWAWTRPRWALLHAVGRSIDRSEIDADWRHRRLYDIKQARGKLKDAYDQYDPKMKGLLDYAGLDPAHALLRWGNFDKTLLLPSTVFEPDDSGRSYRFRPSLRSIWVRNLKLKGGILAYFAIPDGPRFDEVVEGTGAVVVKESLQMTNSWGLRGGEPDVGAAMRGIVLGDSYMQGLFVGDDETPSECLKRFLKERFKTTVEVLNTGHLGYSPEQEYYTLLEYADRIKPQFVILSLFANDFGDLFEVLEGRGDWEENRYWIGKIDAFCKSRGIPCLAVPAPWVNQIEGPRHAGHYPGGISNILEAGGMSYFDPIEEFSEETDKLALKAAAEGKPTTPNPLFNGHLGDGHFSPLGSRLWGDSVGRRLALILERRRVGGGGSGLRKGGG
ncbi:MAG: SGNH/GDSL hydrolase family protein [Paludisphaera borealis]|uniref:SGNH/GDSL hydrolase family protein n=1 Tax=Paludisphaera borealis TaxID=1387353 RepID=UPI00284D49FC|nr:SGNH/GDSL hydrolase family protein [Paludisphaera borealis]MDR3619092.1 SGNH/GDSL hydrolase family protein [Paludisphaera borealis]